MCAREKERGREEGGREERENRKLRRDRKRERIKRGRLKGRGSTRDFVAKQLHKLIFMKNFTTTHACC